MTDQEREQLFLEADQHLGKLHTLSVLLDLSIDCKIKLNQCSGAFNLARTQAYSTAVQSSGHLTSAKTDAQHEREQREMNQQRLDREEMDRRRAAVEAGNKGAGRL